MKTHMLEMSSVGFLGLKNIGIDPITMSIGVLRVKLLAKTCSVAAILNFQFLSGNRWSDVVVPAIFEISILKNPLGQSFMLLSRSAHLKQNMSHIRSTIVITVLYGFYVTTNAK